MAGLVLGAVGFEIAGAAQIAEIGLTRLTGQILVRHVHSAVEIIILHDPPRQCGASKHGSGAPMPLQGTRVERRGASLNERRGRRQAATVVVQTFRPAAIVTGCTNP
jgi:hypothetical protein